MEIETTNRKALTTFPFSKTSTVCNCGKYNLSEFPKLLDILPENYEYKLCDFLQLEREDKFQVTLRMKLSTKDEALEWKRHFEEKSLTTHVKDKTYPHVERVSIFKAQYRCQFFDRRKNKKKLPEKSKFRDCHSILFINIKRYFKNTSDNHMPEYMMMVRLNYAHDHPIDTADVLKKRPLNEDIKRRFLDMFRQGIKPHDALNKYKDDLLQHLGPEKYCQVLCDGHYVPNKQKIYRLYYQIQGKGASAKTLSKRSSKHNPNPDMIAFQNCQDTVIDEEEDNSIVPGCDIVGAGSTDGCLEMSGQNCHLVPNVSSPVDLSGHCINGMSILDPKILMDGMVMPTLNSLGEVDKFAEVYSSIAMHSSVYSDFRKQNVTPPSSSSYSEPELGMGIFSTQSSWENFHQATSALTSQDMELHNPVPDNGHDSYMSITPSLCESLEAQPTVIRETVDSPISRDYPIYTDHQHCSWSLDKPDLQMNSSVVVNSSVDEIKFSRFTASSNQLVTPAKKLARQPKCKLTREVNIKNLTRKWIDKKPKVEAQTQNLASEAVQSILLADEANKLNMRLETFVNILKDKMAANPKLFVPAVRNFTLATETAANDLKLAACLNDFRKTELSIVNNLQHCKQETSVSRGTQTTLMKLCNSRSLPENSTKLRPDHKDISSLKKRCRSTAREKPEK